MLTPLCRAIIPLWASRNSILAQISSTWEKRRAWSGRGSCKPVNLSECCECRNSAIFTTECFSTGNPPRKLAAPVKRDTFDKVAQPLPFPFLFPPNIVWIMSLWFWQSTHARHRHPRHLPFESSLSKPLFFASSKSFHLEGKRDSPVGCVHCCETSTATRAAHKKNQKILILVQNMCQQHQICNFACIGHVFRKMEMYYVCIWTFIIRNMFITI